MKLRLQADMESAMSNSVENCIRCGQSLFPASEKITQDQYQARVATGAHESCDLADFDEENHAYDFDTYGQDLGAFDALY